MPSPKTQLVVYDFDWSLVDQDTDRYVLEVLDTPLRREMETLKKQFQWTDLVDQTNKKLQDKGVTKEQIENALQNIPFHPAMKRAVTALKAAPSPQTTFFCLSNSNQVYIDIILKHHNLTSLFSRITTNKASWSPEGRLSVSRRISPDGPQHGCKIGCSPNMCKGDELVAYLEENGWPERVCYVGDGENDFCPLLRMREQDIAFVRKGFELEGRVAREGPAAGLKVQIKKWVSGWEIEEYFTEIAAGKL